MSAPCAAHRGGARQRAEVGVAGLVPTRSCDGWNLGDTEGSSLQCYSTNRRGPAQDMGDADPDT